MGGYLSPFLFALFINDIKKIIPNYNFLTFADDIKIFRQIESIEDCFALQVELINLVVWINSIGLHLNVSQCLFLIAEMA